MVGSTETSPYVSRDSGNSLVGPGKSSWLRVRARAGRAGEPGGCSAVSSAAGGFHVRPASALVRNGSGQPPGGSPSSPLRKPMTESGMSKRARVVRELRRVGADRDQVQREVADHLGRRRHLDHVAEDVVGRGVHVLDLLELLAEAERDRLLAQVGELPAGDLVAVDATGRRGQAGLERRVDPAGRLPVGLERVDAASDRPVSRAAWSVAETSADSGGCDVVPAIEAQAASTASTPASIAASRVASWPPGVSWVCRCTGRSNSSRSAVTSVRAAGARSRPAMSLIASTCAPASTIRSARREVVVERVERLVGVGQVAGVAERDLGDGGAGRAHRLDRRPHLLDVVERVEDPEDVDAGRRRLLDEGLGHLRRVRRVADRVAPAQQHLQADVGHRLAQRGQPLPRVLGRKRSATSYVAPPHASSDHSSGVVRATWPATASRSRVRTRVASSDWWASRKVVSVTATRVLGAQRAGELLGPTLQQQLAGAVGGRDVEVDVGQLGDRVDASPAPGRAAG